MEIREMPQEYTSKNTCHNRFKLPNLFRLGKFKEGTTCVDYGGGAYDTVEEFLATKGVKGFCYDPYNRTPAHNQAVIDAVSQLNGVDYVCSSNVLNVIKEKEVRLNVIRNMSMMGKDDATFYFVTYEGDRTGIGKESTKGWQNNKRTKEYIPEIREFFEDVKISGFFITAKGKKPI